MNFVSSKLQATQAVQYNPPAPKTATAATIRLQLYAALSVFDVLAICLGFATASLLVQGFLSPVDRLLPAGAFAATYLIFAAYGHAMSHEVVQRPWASVNRALTALLAASATWLLLNFASPSEPPASRLLWSASFLGSVVFLVGIRFGFDYFISRKFRSQLFDQVLICDDFEVKAPRNFRVVDARKLGLEPDINDPMSLHRMATSLYGADRVVVACPPEKYTQWAKFLRGSNLASEIIMPELNELGALSVNRQGANTTVGISSGPLCARNRLIKRTFDVALTLPIVLLLSPLFLAVAIAVRMHDGGPVFFKQLRMGHGNKLFEVFKFRSMRQEQSDFSGTRSASRDDDRITPIGRIIRATSIDELPQLLNVLKGDMSLVGPRPHALGSQAEDQLFWEVDQRYWDRHAIKPGITGLAQVRGFRGATHRKSDLSNRLQADLEYLNGWSLWRDIYILFKTFAVVVHKNAY